MFAYGVKINDILVLTGGKDDKEAVKNAVYMYQQLHPDTTKSILEAKAIPKLIDEWKPNKAKADISD